MNEKKILSNGNCCLAEREPYKTIISLIVVGKKNALHLKELIKYTGINNRDLRRYIEELRRNGAVIISNNKGYYFPDNDIEIKRYIKQEESRAKSIFYTLRSAKRHLKGLGE